MHTPGMTLSDPIVLDTPRALYEHNHRIVAYCSPCERWKALSLLDFVRMGKAEHAIANLSLRCGECGEKGSIQVRPPHPEIDRYGPK